MYYMGDWEMPFNVIDGTGTEAAAALLEAVVSDLPPAEERSVRLADKNAEDCGCGD
jgi:hypothetical protein